ncbi:Pentatricopeptide repeat-containing protein [Actinidia chinensis var. chinensis]|uniref:Pentatricopeptide repeat-containing protein n=1 Tax=Actinidia chinensis var. chinensis TaxID=1590841 RepID=A0A2R6Q0S1_ACTCC|nr:Pentatricopeptide repeat-containing protein [Actinidia chinensis var. chinensis]
MASLPSVLVVGNILKLEPELRKHTTSLPIEKRTYSTGRLGKALDPINLDFREALSRIREGTRVDSSVYVPLLQECMEKKSVSESQIIHGHIIKTDSITDSFLMTFLVNVYAKCGAMESARKVFDKLPSRNVVSWTTLITGYVHNSQPELAIQVFLEMLEVGGYPTDYTLGIVLNGCSSMQNIELGKQIHGYIVKYEIESNASVGNALCGLYSKCGSFNSAVKAFWRIGEKNVISWTTVISSCGDNGEPAMGLSLFSVMISEGIEPNEFTLTSVLSLCHTMQDLDVGSQVHSLSIKLGYELSPPVTNSIMHLYLKCGCVHEAKKLFDGMEEVSLVTWNAMIAGYAQMIGLAEDGLSAYRSGVEALNIFLRLHRSCTKPDLFTFSSILTICSSLVASQQGEQVHAQTIKTGFLADVVVGTALVNMYNKCGSIERASKAFVELSTRTLISWTNMITGFAQHGRSQQALHLFQDMRFVGVRPNQITFVGVLSACSHAGMVDEALAYFEMMKNEYKIKPVMDHFACLIDMFVRLGRLDEAFDIIKTMDFEPNEFIWSMLVAGCRNQGNLELGFYAAEQLLKLNPKNPEICFLLLNLYLSAERWKDVSRVRKLMKEEKMGKIKDWSWISIKDKVYSFKPSDQFHPQRKEVDQLLGDLLEKARTLGYESQGALEVTEENDEGTTFSSVHHSEKLAVMFGLLKTPNAAPIHVIKSISMCQDCHSFIKYVSALTAREIIVRDSKRLHKFVNGDCSCGDFGSLI